LTHAVENAASCRVADKAGFRLAEFLPSHKRFGDGLVHDEHLHIRGDVDHEPLLIRLAAGEKDSAGKA
jgi:hypothetical protein